MASKLSHESRRMGELILIVGIAVLALVLGSVATRGLPDGDGNGIGSVNGAPQPTATPMVSPTVAPEPEATRDPRDTWVPPEQFPGVPAIEPSLDTAAPGEPRVTVSDVEAYVASDAPDVAGADDIVSIEFLPANVVEARFDAGPGAYGGRILCVVELRGTFRIVGLPPEVVEQLGEAGKKPVAPRAILVFDARTGNLLTISPRS